jgi:hexosaminidase
VARFDPSVVDWTNEQRERVLGAQAQLWTEWITTEREIEFALFPRLCAFAAALTGTVAFGDDD